MAKIEATEYTRQDGLKAIKLASGRWVVRKTSGPAWFYSANLNDWVIVTRIKNVEDFGMAFDEAMKLLNTLEDL